MQEGPKQTILYTCHECNYLKTEPWEFYGENDEIDRGTDSTCLKKDKHISSYWSKSTLTPKWCPFL